MPIVSIRMAKGRDVDQKRRLAAEVTSAVAQSLDLPPELVCTGCSCVATAGVDVDSVRTTTTITVQ